MASSAGNPFRLRPRRAVPDPSPDALTDAERAHIRERLQSGNSVRAPIVRKLLRLCDQRQVRIAKALRVSEQAEQFSHRYPGQTASRFIGEILRGEDTL